LVADKGTSNTRLGYYGTILGLCGSEADAQFLEDLIKQPVKGIDFRLGMDGIMSGYLLLKGEEGLKLLEETKLKDGVKTPFCETYCAMQAVRFAWEYGEAIKKDRHKQSMRLLLDRPEMADLAISHLARWQDWAIQDQVMAIYDKPGFEEPSTKRAIVRYMLTCSQDTAENDDQNPIEEHAVTAKKHLGTLRRNDPETYKQASRFFSIN
jgi:hypothetical protein